MFDLQRNNYYTSNQTIGVNYIILNTQFASFKILYNFYFIIFFNSFQYDMHIKLAFSNSMSNKWEEGVSFNTKWKGIFTLYFNVYMHLPKSLCSTFILLSLSHHQLSFFTLSKLNWFFPLSSKVLLSLRGRLVLIQVMLG